VDLLEPLNFALTSLTMKFALVLIVSIFTTWSTIP